ncbi:MAG: RNA 2',3'-cyclic phosphodiesterase [Kosmotoga sp.]|nr:MAG: RNA 2',3'-cyclic phosphodiesterase [Kosmotoga sp.]
MRTFVAIDVGEKVVNQVDSVGEKLRKMGFKANWVSGKNTHITLEFLGDIETEKVKSVASMISKRLRGFPSFTLKTTKLGYFKKKNLPRVIWIGLEHSDLLTQLFRETKIALEGLGFKIDGRFHPHITIGRMKYSPPYWMKLLKTISIEEVVFPVEEVIVYKSILTPKGAIYKKQYSCDFEGGLIDHELKKG